MSPKFPCVTLGVRELPFSCFASKVDLVCVECLQMIKPKVFVFVPLEVDYSLGDGCVICEHSLREMKCLQGCSMVFVPRVTQGNKDAGLVQDFILLLFGVNQERQGETEIPLYSPSGGKLLLRPSSSYDLLGRVTFRILSNIYDEAFSWK